MPRASTGGDDADDVDHLLDLAVEVARDKDGLAQLGEAAERLAHGHDAGRIETVRRFVEEEQLRVAQQGGGDPETLRSRSLVFVCVRRFHARSPPLTTLRAVYRPSRVRRTRTRAWRGANRPRGRRLEVDLRRCFPPKVAGPDLWQETGAVTCTVTRRGSRMRAARPRRGPIEPGPRPRSSRAFREDARAPDASSS